MQTKSAEKAPKSAKKAQKDQEESSAQIPSGISLRRSPQPSSHSADGAAPLTYTPALSKSKSKFASAVSSQLAEVRAFSDLLAAEGPPLPTFEQISHRANLPHDIQEATVAASALAAHQSPAEIHANSLEAAAIFQQLQEAKLAMAEMNKRLEDQQASHRQALLARDQEASSTFHQLQQFLHEQELRRTEETRRLHSHMASLSEAVAQQAIAQPEIVAHQRLEGNQSQPIIVHSSSSRSHGRDDAPTSAPQALSSSIDRPTTPTQSFKPVAPSHPASPNKSNPASPARPAPLPSAATDATNLGAEDKALIKQQARAIKQEYAAIAHAQARIAALQQQQPKLTFKVKKPSRETERRNAQLTGDSELHAELVQHRSIRIKEEARSDDDAEEVQRHLDPAIAHHNLFHHTNKHPTHTRHGYLLDGTVVDADDSSDASSSDPDDGELDDDGDPDYEPNSDESTPSDTKRSSRKFTISADERLAFEAFKAFQASQAQHPAVTSAQLVTRAPQAQQAAPATSSSVAQTKYNLLNAIQAQQSHLAPSSQSSKQSSTRSSPTPAERGLIPAEVILSLLQQRAQSEAPPPTVDQHGRVQREQLTEVSIPLPAPEHGEWDNVDHLMSTFFPAYERYKNSCKRNHHYSIWELYTSVQKRKIAKLLTKIQVPPTMTSLLRFNDSLHSQMKNFSKSCAKRKDTAPALLQKWRCALLPSPAKSQAAPLGSTTRHLGKTASSNLQQLAPSSPSDSLPSTESPSQIPSSKLQCKRNAFPPGKNLMHTFSLNSPMLTSSSLGTMTSPSANPQ